MQLLDAGRFEEWAAGFTEDGVFATEAVPEPAVGRDQLASGSRRAHADLTAQGIQRHHWLGMVVAEDVGGNRVRARSYALTLTGTGDGTAELRFFNLCRDTLHYDPVDDSWLIRERRVTRQ
ncbi:nuclear transport factor 2 family protein [Nocardia alba]|uniref:SnoaL-like protein n=1 Tax=Nocardia alba TaxID=225051 RepID=A0A4R1F6H0_9NOCA|nr:nuclear transport factor 2 family protein [Nocardia alba]TCJ89877.1 SnoaL-like protein [Nocardia alba]